MRIGDIFKTGCSYYIITEIREHWVVSDFIGLVVAGEFICVYPELNCRVFITSFEIGKAVICSKEETHKVRLFLSGNINENR